MYQFNRDAIDITNFSKKHYQELCDFIASEKPFVNDRISYVNGGVSYGGLDYNDNRHHISCNILATPALKECCYRQRLGTPSFAGPQEG